MKAYENIYDENSKQKRKNSFLKESTESTALKLLADYATVFNEYDGDWASFTSRFMEAASEGYGDPTLIVDRTVGAENRVPQMSNTDLYLQTTLAPNSRNSESTIFLGPEGDDSKIYSVPTIVQYSVSQDETVYYTTLPSDDLDINTYISKVEKNLNFPHGFEEFGTFPPSDNDTVLIDRPDSYTYADKMANHLVEPSLTSVKFVA
jgi:hypothetical protein